MPYLQNIVRCTLLLFVVFFVYSYGSYAEARELTQHEFTLFTAAKKHYDNKDYARVIQGLESYFAKKSTKHAFGYELYGAALLANKQAQKAVQVLEEGFAAYPKHLSMGQNLAMAYYQVGKPLLAAEIFEKVYLLGESKNPDLAYTAAYFYFQAKRFEKAASLLAPVVWHAESKEGWAQLLAQTYASQKKFKSSVAVLEKALSRYQKSAQLWRMLGYVRFQQNNRKAAAVAYDMAYRIEKPTQKDKDRLAALYWSINAPHAGERLLSSSSSSAQLLDAMADAFARMGDVSSAITMAEKAVAKDSDSARRLRLGYLLYRNGNLQEATRVFSQLAKGKNNATERAAWALAVIAWDEKKWEELEARLQDVAAMDGDFAGRANQLLGFVQQIIQGEPEAFTENSSQ